MLGLLALPFIAYVLGRRGMMLLTIGIAPLPMLSHTLSLPLTWVLVAAVAILVLGDALLLGSTSWTRLNPWDAFLPALFLASFFFSEAKSGVSDVQTAVPQLFAVPAAVAAYYLAMVTFDSPRWVRRALCALVAGAVATLLLSLVELAAPSIHLPGLFSTTAAFQQLTATGATVNRLSGVLGDYELLAELLAIAGVASLWLGATNTGWRRLLWVLTSFSCVGGIIATGTRGGIVVYLVGVVLLLVARGQGRLRQFLVLACLFGFALLIAPLPWRGTTQSLLVRFATTPTSNGLFGFLDRQGIWPVFLRQFHFDWRLLWGIGPPEFDFRAWGVYPHSIYIYLLYTQGLFGLVPFVALLVRSAWPVVAAIRGRTGWTLEAILALLVLLFATDELKIEYMRLYNYELVVWVLLGLAAASRRMGKESS